MALKKTGESVRKTQVFYSIAVKGGLSRAGHGLVHAGFKGRGASSSGGRLCLLAPSKGRAGNICLC